MAIKINVNTQPYHEFEILDKDYKVYTDDASIKKYQELETNLQNQKEDDSVEGTKQLLKESFDSLMGEGSFEEIYEKVGKSSQIMTEILVQVFEHVEAENNRSVAQKFLNEKARKQR